MHYLFLTQSSTSKYIPAKSPTSPPRRCHHILSQLINQNAWNLTPLNERYFKIYRKEERKEATFILPKIS